MAGCCRWATPGDLAYWHERRDAIRRAMDDAGRDFDREFVDDGPGRSAARRPTIGALALERLQALAAEGAGHLVLGVSAALGPDGSTPSPARSPSRCAPC